jgi:alpha/beta superfamily hydrolase
MHVFLPGPAGRLEALVDDVASPRAAVVVCHPHPLYGGTMRTNVVHRIARGFQEAGCAALRFNFRGAGRSEGTHDRGAGEQEDVRAAVDWLAARHPGLPLRLAGFSFGAVVGMRVGAADGRILALLAAGLPLRTVELQRAGIPEFHADWDFLAASTKPKQVIQGGSDEFGGRAEIEALFATFAAPKRLHVVDGVGHLFDGGLDEVQRVTRAYAESLG